MRGPGPDRQEGRACACGGKLPDDKTVSRRNRRVMRNRRVSCARDTASVALRRHRANRHDQCHDGEPDDGHEDQE